MNTIALIVAGGQGIRFGGEIPKQFRLVHDRPLLSWTMRQYELASKIDEIVLVVPDDYLLYTHEKIVVPYGFRKFKKIIIGGETRQQSVYRGLKSIPISTSFVAIHDGARPIVRPEDIDNVVEAAKKDHAAILARPVDDTVKRVEADYILTTLDRSKLYLAETPQVFQYDLIVSAHDKFISGETATDDAFLVESLGFKVRTVIPSGPNIKVTTEDDLLYIKYTLNGNQETAN